MGHSTLIYEIMQLSEGDSWEVAQKEWVIKIVYFSKAPMSCLCGHYPIMELCIVSNKKNHNEATIGSCCVKKFMQLPSNKIFDAVKRVKKEAQKSLNEETVTHMYKQKWISQWEYEFYLDTCRKRKLTPKQIETRRKINQKILVRLDKEQPPLSAEPEPKPGSEMTADFPGIVTNSSDIVVDQHTPQLQASEQDIKEDLGPDVEQANQDH